MATTKTYSVVGTSTFNGETKVRFANDFVTRFKILVKNGHDNIELIELGDEYTKAECLKILMQHERFQTDEQQGAIYDFVVRNAYDIKYELTEESRTPA
jgi:hypothetical protein